MHATLFDCFEKYFTRRLTYHRQCKGQQKWFLKIILWEYIEKETFQQHSKHIYTDEVIHSHNLLKTSE